MAKAYFHIDTIKKTKSEIHNTRKKDFDYINKGLTQFNESYQEHSIKEREKIVSKKYENHFKKKHPKNAEPIKEAIVLIKNDTTMQDLKKLKNELEKEIGIQVFQIHIHKDEGHFDEQKRWKPNLHAHLVLDITNKDTGRRYRMQKKEMRKIQDITAEVLGMERGKSKKITKKEHLEPVEFKILQAKQKLKSLIQNLDYYRSLIHQTENKNIKRQIYSTLDKIIPIAKNIKEFKEIAEANDIIIREKDFISEGKKETQFEYDISKFSSKNEKETQILSEKVMPSKFTFQALSFFDKIQEGQKSYKPYHQKNIINKIIKKSIEKTDSMDDFLNKIQKNGATIKLTYKENKVEGYKIILKNIANPIEINSQYLQNEYSIPSIIKNFKPKEVPIKTNITTIDTPPKNHTDKQQKQIIKKIIQKTIKQSDNINTFFDILKGNDVDLEVNRSQTKINGYRIKLKNTTNPISFKATEIDRSFSVFHMEKIFVNNSKTSKIESKPIETEVYSLLDKIIPLSKNIKEFKKLAEANNIIINVKERDTKGKKESYFEYDISKFKPEIERTNQILLDRTMPNRFTFQTLSSYEKIDEEHSKKNITTIDTPPKNHTDKQQKQMIKNIIQKTMNQSNNINTFFDILKGNDVDLEVNRSQTKINGYRIKLKNTTNPISFKATEIDRSFSVFHMEKIFVNNSKTSKIESKPIETEVYSLLDKIIPIAKNIKEFKKFAQANNIIINVKEIDTKGKKESYFEYDISKFKPEIKRTNQILLDRTMPNRFTFQTLSSYEKIDEEHSKKNITTIDTPPKNHTDKQQKQMIKNIIQKTMNQSNNINTFFDILKGNDVDLEVNRSQTKINGYRIKLKNTSNPISFKATEIDRSFSVFHMEKIFVNNSKTSKIESKPIETEVYSLLDKIIPIAKNIKEFKKFAQANNIIINVKEIDTKGKIESYFEYDISKFKPEIERTNQILLDRTMSNRFTFQTLSTNMRAQPESPQKIIINAIKKHYYTSTSIEEFSKNLNTAGIEFFPISIDDKLKSYNIKFSTQEKNIFLDEKDLPKMYHIKSIIPHFEDMKILRNEAKTDMPFIEQKKILQRVAKKSIVNSPNITEFFDILKKHNIEIKDEKDTFNIKITNTKNPCEISLSSLGREFNQRGIDHIFRMRNEKAEDLPYIYENKQKDTLQKICYDTLKNCSNTKEFFINLEKNDVTIIPKIEDDKLVNYEISLKNVANPILFKPTEIDKFFNIENLKIEFNNRVFITGIEQKSIVEKGIIDAIKSPEIKNFQMFFDNLEKDNFVVEKVFDENRLKSFSIKIPNLSNPITFISDKIQPQFSIDNFVNLFEDRKENKEFIAQPITNTAGPTIISLIQLLTSHQGSDESIEDTIDRVGQQEAAKRKRMSQKENRDMGIE